MSGEQKKDPDDPEGSTGAGEMMNSTIEVKSHLVGDELKKLVIESVCKVFEADSKHFMDGYLEHLAKEKAEA